VTCTLGSRSDTGCREPGSAPGRDDVLLVFAARPARQTQFQEVHFHQAAQPTFEVAGSGGVAQGI
jgi:hypothetical protein